MKILWLYYTGSAPVPLSRAPASSAGCCPESGHSPFFTYSLLKPSNSKRINQITATP